MESALRVAGVIPSEAALRQQDRARLYEARAILLDRFTNPPTVDMLARLVGINRTTLRRGFKDMFGETIADFCQNRRMTLARELLKDPRFTIAEIAETVGYGQPTNFSAAFRRHFDALPRDFRSH
ncbi:MAG: helix-turn-helix transcriptional regulator, partial [Sphingomonadaceae bacterium]